MRQSHRYRLWPQYYPQCSLGVKSVEFPFNEHVAPYTLKLYTIQKLAKIEANISVNFVFVIDKNGYKVSNTALNFKTSWNKDVFSQGSCCLITPSHTCCAAQLSLQVDISSSIEGMAKSRILTQEFCICICICRGEVTGKILNRRCPRSFWAQPQPCSRLADRQSHCPKGQSFING